MDLEALYIKKAKITIIDHSGKEIPDNSTVGTYMSPQPRGAYRPKYRLSGIFINDKQNPKFIITGQKSSTHHLYLSVLLKPLMPLDNYKLLGTLWSSYFQDRHGYYWQIISTEGLCQYSILHPKLIIQS